MLSENQSDQSPAAAETTIPSNPIPTKSLGELLRLAQEADDAILENDVDLEELGANIKDKVDSIVDYLDFVDSRRKKILERSNELMAKAASFAAKQDRLEAYVTKRMFDTGTPKLPGNFYRFIIKPSEAVIPKVAKATAGLFLKYKGLVTKGATPYSWDKRALKERLKAQDPKAMEVAYIEIRQNLDIKPLT